MFRGTWNILDHGTWNHVKAAPPPCHVQEASCFPVIPWGTSSTVSVAVANLNDNSETTEKWALEIMVENYLTSWKEKQTFFQLPTTNPYQQDEESPSFAMAALLQWNINLNGSQWEAWCSADWRAANVLGANCALMASPTFSKQQNPWTMKRHICTNSASQCLSYMFELVFLKT